MRLSPGSIEPPRRSDGLADLQHLPLLRHAVRRRRSREAARRAAQRVGAGGAQWWSQNEPRADGLGRQRAAAGGRFRRWRSAELSRRATQPSGLGLVDLPPLEAARAAVRTIARVDEQLAAEWKLPDGLRARRHADLHVATTRSTSRSTRAPRRRRSRSSTRARSTPARPIRRGRCRARRSASTRARDPDEMRAALDACVRTLEREAWFYAADERKELAFFPHVVRATGTLSVARGGNRRRCADGVPDRAAARVDDRRSTPRSRRRRCASRSGSARRRRPTSAAAISSAICRRAKRRRARSPRRSSTWRARRSTRRARRAAAGEALGARPRGGTGAGKYRVLATGERLSDKPEHLTHLLDDESLVDKIAPAAAAARQARHAAGPAARRAVRRRRRRRARPRRRAGRGARADARDRRRRGDRPPARRRGSWPGSAPRRDALSLAPHARALRRARSCSRRCGRARWWRALYTGARLRARGRARALPRAFPSADERADLEAGAQSPVVARSTS